MTNNLIMIYDKSSYNKKVQQKNNNLIMEYKRSTFEKNFKKDKKRQPKNKQEFFRYVEDSIRKVDTKNIIKF